MSRNSQKLYNSINELNSIIRELDSIENGVRNDFQGIGSEKCADVIKRVKNEYIKALNKLRSIDASKL